MRLAPRVSLCAAILLFTFAVVAEAVEPIPLRAGPLTMSFDAENVFLRYVRVGADEVLRGVNAAIRDQHWSTVAPKVSNLEVDQHDDHFKVTFDVLCAADDIDFRWKGSITGSAEGVVEFTFDGIAHATFKRNRIGFCVLHGPSAAGQPWVITTADGKKSEGHFPRYVSPHQPAKNLRAITHEVSPGIRAEVQFEGEIFEMEDQRNWTDASFKTYCTPLEIPYPVEILEGTRISQKIRIRLAGDLGDLGDHLEQTDAGRVLLTLRTRESALPRLGVQVSGEVPNLTEVQLKRLAALKLDHLRVDLALSGPSLVTELRRATAQAKTLGVSLQVGLNLGEAPAFTTLLNEIKNLRPPVTHWLVTGGDPDDYHEARRQLAPVLGPVKVGVTRITNFVDLNRARPEESSIEVVGFAINPQIHAFDNESIVETLPIHGDVVNSARQFVGDRPLVIGPITLRPQLVNGVDPPGGPPVGTFPTYVDTRQGTPFTAAWTLGSVKYLAEADAHSATYYETVGWNGIMDVAEVDARPAAFPSQPGALFPVYRLLRELGEFAGGTVRQVDSSNPLGAVGLALSKGGRIRVLVANLTDEPQRVTLRGVDAPISVQLLGASKSRTTAESQISLPPYGIARIERAMD